MCRQILDLCEEHNLTQQNFAIRYDCADSWDMILFDTHQDSNSQPVQPQACADSSRPLVPTIQKPKFKISL